MENLNLIEDSSECTPSYFTPSFDELFNYEKPQFWLFSKPTLEQPQNSDPIDLMLNLSNTESAEIEGQCSCNQPQEKGEQVVVSLEDYRLRFKYQKKMLTMSKQMLEFEKMNFNGYKEMNIQDVTIIQKKGIGNILTFFREQQENFLNIYFNMKKHIRKVEKMETTVKQLGDTVNVQEMLNKRVEKIQLRNKLKFIRKKMRMQKAQSRQFEGKKIKQKSV